MQTEHKIERIILASTSLAAATYSERHQTLEVEFRRGAVYRYLSVPRHIFNELRTADSKGRFFNRAIRNQHRFEQVS